MATVSGNNTFLVEIKDVFGGLLKGEKHPFHSKNKKNATDHWYFFCTLYLTTEHMVSKLCDPRKYEFR